MKSGNPLGHTGPVTGLLYLIQVFLILDHRGCKSFPLNAGFGYTKFPFKTGSLCFLDESFGVTNIQT